MSFSLFSKRVHKPVSAIFDLLIVFALFEQIFWEGDSLYFVKIASFFAIGLLPYLFLIKRPERPSILLPFIFIASILLVFEVALAIDVALYARLKDINSQILIGYPEILSLLSLLVIFVISISTRKHFKLERYITIMLSGLGIIGSLLLLFLQGSRYGFAFSFDILSGELWLVISLFVLFCRLLAVSPGSVLPSRLDFIISNYTSGLFLLAMSILFLFAAQCFVISGKLLPVNENSDFKVSKSFLVTLLVTEDPIFLSHYGADSKRIRDVVRETIEYGRYERGASTLPMQLAKIHYLTSEKTMLRKIRQLILGLILEARYSKEMIMEAYLELVPFSDGVIGLTSASKQFFGVEPKLLNEAQSLSLVLAIFDPGAYNPTKERNFPRIAVRSALVENRISRYGQTLAQDLDAIRIAQ